MSMPLRREQMLIAPTCSDSEPAMDVIAGEATETVLEIAEGGRRPDGSCRQVGRDPFDGRTWRDPMNSAASGPEDRNGGRERSRRSQGHQPAGKHGRSWMR